MPSVTAPTVSACLYVARYLRCHNYTGVTSAGETRCAMSVKRCLTRTCCRPCGRRRGNYIVSIYLLVKLLYLVNAVAQIFLLDVFLGGSPFDAYGLAVLRGAVDLNADWPTTNSTRFPRVTICDMKVRRLGSVHRYSIQCVLTINFYNEKVFLFVWFWLVMVAVVTLYSLIMWLVRFRFSKMSRRYVKHHLYYLNKLTSPRDLTKVNEFIDKYLREDGVFILRLMAQNTSTITATEFIASLWENFKNKPLASDAHAD